MIIDFVNISGIVIFNTLLFTRKMMGINTFE